MMRRLLLVSVLALGSAVGACSHYSEELSTLDKEMGTPVTQTAMASNPQDIAPAAGADTGAFRKELAREYYDMARYENDKAYDYKASKIFTGKAMAAAEGKIPTPSKISAYDIPADRASELTEARKELVIALKTSNTPDNATTLARAQCRYECWLERAEEASDESHYAGCRDEFRQAMAALTMPASGEPAPTVYDISFAANSSLIDPASETTIALIAQILNDPKNTAYTATLSGFGTAKGEYADSVLTARVNSIQQALVSKGVSIDRLKPVVATSVSPDAAGKVQVTIIAPVAGPGTATSQTFVPVTPKVISVTPVQVPDAAPVPAPAPSPAQ